ncbi:efflux RND transporter permease subunit [Robertkochia sp. 1368]|nr:efflux RND transporter permease subunit [Robertkochia sediminum]
MCIAVIGIILLPRLSLQLTPNRNTPKLSVSFSWPDASARVLEQEVTSRLEGLFNGVSGMEKVSSLTKKGQGSIELEFKKQSDPEVIRFEVASLIRQTYPRLPDGVSYPELSVSHGSQAKEPILTYSLNAPESPYYIQKYAEEELSPELAAVEGVSKIAIYGGSRYEWVITYRPEILESLHLQVGDLNEALNAYFEGRSLGIVKVPGAYEQELSLEFRVRSHEITDWSRVPVGHTGDRVIRLTDVATVRFMEEEVSSYHRINGLNSLNFVIYPETGQNTITVARKVMKRMENLKPVLASGYQVQLVENHTGFLQRELQTIKLRSLLSLLILLLLCVAVYRNLRYLIILFITIGVNLLLAVICYYLLGVELQLYSFAGITISLGVIIDNTIIMMDHLRNKGNKNVFLALLAATLTTIGAVTVVFFLEEEQRANLYDFAMVIAINLGTSLLVTLLLVPALMEKIPLKNKIPNRVTSRARNVVRFTRSYSLLISWLSRPLWKVLVIILFILGFGIPLHLAPDRLEDDHLGARVYNAVMHHEWVHKKLRPTLEPWIGGSLRLFTQYVMANSYYRDPGRTQLFIRGSMAEGGSIVQLNGVMAQMEQYLSGFEEIAIFETRIDSPKSGEIRISFKEAFENGGFPDLLKNRVQSKAVDLGGLDWSVYGVGKAFSNAMGSAGYGNGITLEGYNLDALLGYAKALQGRIEQQGGSRIKSGYITRGRYGREPRPELLLEFKPQAMAMAGVSAQDLYSGISNRVYRSRAQEVIREGETQAVTLRAEGATEFDFWDLKNSPVRLGEATYKLGDIATLERRLSGFDIARENQLYQVSVRYSFIGSNKLAQKFRKQIMDEFRPNLAVGYRMLEKEHFYWDIREKSQYRYLGLILLIIFFICAILLESLKQPLVILSMIPISFIGVFLTFYLFELNFDQGGYASFILLAGLSVNAALYIVNDLNNLRKTHPMISDSWRYMKAFNSKIIPILLTVITTIAGLIPFLVNGREEVFWFAFALGSISGLLLSTLILFFLLPILIINKN